MSKINNYRNVAILMAVYNGGPYLREQIDSIIHQSFANWTLYIQDDGSSDDTLNIVKSYSDERIQLVDIGLSRQGAGMNFMSLLNMVDSEYYMFCDQDDVWFPDKIEKSLTRMREEESKHGKMTPIIVHTDRTHVNADLSVRMKSEFNPRGISQARLERKINQLKHPDILAIYTIVGGCTMMFNKAVKQIAFPFLNIRVHDSICAMAVANHGGVISTITEPTMYYRIHSTNTCGVSDERLLPKILHIFDSISKNMRGYHIWKLYGRGGFLKFLYYRIKYFIILRLN